MHFEDELARDLTTLAEEVDPNALSRIEQRLRIDGSTAKRPSPLRRHARLTTVAAGAVVAASTIAVLNLAGVVGGTSPHAHAPLPDFQSAVIKPGEPCADAHREQMSELLASSHTPIWMPNTPDANAKTLSGTWMCHGVLVLSFGEVTVSFESPGNMEPKRLWNDLANDNNGGRVETVLGQPAFVKPPLGDRGRGEVLVVVDGTLIRAIGDGTTPAADLVSMVNSIDIGNPVGK